MFECHTTSFKHPKMLLGAPSPAGPISAEIHEQKQYIINSAYDRLDAYLNKIKYLIRSACKFRTLGSRKISHLFAVSAARNAAILRVLFTTHQRQALLAGDPICDLRSQIVTQIDGYAGADDTRGS